MMQPGGKRLPRILIVDDDPLAIRLVQGLFDENEYNVLTGRSGEQALLELKQRPSVLILNNVLPDADGLSVLTEARRLDPHLPVIFITTRGSSQTAIEAMKRGAFDYLHKPLDLGVLEHQVQLAKPRPDHVPVVVVRLQVQRVAVGEEAAEALGDRLAVLVLDPDVHCHLRSPSVCLVEW